MGLSVQIITSTNRAEYAIRKPSVHSVRGDITRRGPPAGAGGLVQMQNLHQMIHGTETEDKFFLSESGMLQKRS